MKKMKKWAVLTLSAVMAVTMMPMSVLAAGSAGSAAKAAPAGGTLDEMAAQMQDRTNDPFAFRGGKLQKQISIAAEDYPAKYDLRDVNGKSYVTPVKFQNPFGTCWGFSAITAAETSILGAGLAQEDGLDEKTLDLSEKHLVNFVAMPIDDPDHSQYGEGMHYTDGITVADKLSAGGMPFYATTLFSSGMGPNLESNGTIFEYHGANEWTDKRIIDGKWDNFSYSKQDDWSMPSELRFYQSYVLKESYMLPSPAHFDEDGEYEYYEAGVDAIKEQLMNKRGVEIGFLADTSSPDQNNDGKYISSNWAHYTDSYQHPNHGVCIIGWDDDYPASNFVRGKQPPGNGAWLIKNSWGSGEEQFPNRGRGNWGITNDEGVHTGYFWLSYYDQSICIIEALAFDKSNVEKDYLLDQYDYMPVTEISSADVDGKTSTSNVFRADSHVQLEQISCQTAAPGTEVSYEVYLLHDDFSDPVDGIRMASGSEEYKYGGFHKIALSQPVPVQRGQYYSIIITQKTPEGKYNINVPYDLNKAYARENGYNSWSVGVINPRESFLLIDGEWYDYSDEFLRRYITGPQIEYMSMDNFPIKGFCTELPDISLDDPVGGENTLYLTADSAGDEVSTDFTARFIGDKDLLPDESGIEWAASPGSEGIFALTPFADDPSKCKVTALAPGKGYITITANGIGTRIIPMEVAVPDDCRIEGLKAGKKKLKVTVSLMEDLADGVQIAYRAKGSSKWKTAKLKIPKFRTTLKGLKKGRRYQVRVRSYVNWSDGKTYYSKWSKIRTSKKIK